MTMKLDEIKYQLMTSDLCTDAEKTLLTKIMIQLVDNVVSLERQIQNIYRIFDENGNL